jgi:hypothetical protein
MQLITLTRSRQNNKYNKQLEQEKQLELLPGLRDRGTKAGFLPNSLWRCCSSLVLNDI